MTKICADCLHYRAATGECHHPKNLGERDIVTGQQYTNQEPKYLRQWDESCGKAGAWFKARPADPMPLMSYRFMVAGVKTSES